jgi:hypothetical protein
MLSIPGTLKKLRRSSRETPMYVEYGRTWRRKGRIDRPSLNHRATSRLYGPPTRATQFRQSPSVATNQALFPSIL